MFRGRVFGVVLLTVALLLGTNTWAKKGGKPGGGGGGGGVSNPAFAYSSQAKGNKPTQLYIATADGSQTQRLTDENFTQHGNPAWSPDGTKIAFLGRSSSTSPWVDGIYVYELSGGTISQVFAINSAWSNVPEEIDWSFDGEQIAFTTANNEIHLLDIDAGTTTAVLETADGYAEIRTLAWSPDDAQIVFSGNSPAQGGAAYDDLFVLTLSTGVITNLSDTANSQEQDPDWTEDGIAYLRDGAVYTMDDDGTNVTQVVSSASSRKDVCWSPDGSHLGFIEDGVLYEVRLSDGDLTELLSPRFGMAAAARKSESN